MITTSNPPPTGHVPDEASNSGLRWIIAGLLPLACLVLHLLPLWAFGADLPDRVATHFDVTGTADGSMLPQRLLLWSGLWLVLPGVLMLLAAGLGSPRMPRPWPPFLCGLGVFLALLGAGLCADLFYSQRGNDQWQDATGPGVGVLLAPLLAALCAAGAAMLGKRLPYNASSRTYAADPNSKQPAMHLSQGERVLFVETISAGWALVLTAVTLLACLATAAFAAWPVAAVIGLSALPLLFLSSMRVQADNSGLSVRSALCGVRFVHIDAADIEQASVIDVEPLKWGGWGYRGSLKLAGTAAVVLRSGPGLHLQLSNDRTFVVTLNDPDGAAAVLNSSRSQDPS